MNTIIRTRPGFVGRLRSRQSGLPTGLLGRFFGRAMEGGSYGQTIRVKNEATGDVYQVVLTAPQEGSIGAPRETDPAKASAE